MHAPVSSVVPVPERVKAIPPVPLDITKAKAAGEVDPAIVKVTELAPLLVIEPAPAPDESEPTVLLNPFKSKAPPFPEVFPITTSEVEGNADVDPSRIVADAEASNKVFDQLLLVPERTSIPAPPLEAVAKRTSPELDILPLKIVVYPPPLPIFKRLPLPVMFPENVDVAPDVPVPPVAIFAKPLPVTVIGTEHSKLTLELFPRFNRVMLDPVAVARIFKEEPVSPVILP